MTRIIYPFIICFVTITSTLSSQQHAPIFTYEKLGSRFVEAINSTIDSVQSVIAKEVYTEATQEKLGIPRIINHFKKLHETYAPLEYHHSEALEFNKPSGKSIVMHVYARKRGEIMWNDFQFYLEPNAPHRIDRITFVAEVAEPVALPNGSIRQEETRAWLQGYIKKLEDENDLSGSISISHGGEMLFKKYWGWADIENKQKINAKTRFGLASGSKMFTAIAIVQLMEQGKLKLTDRLIDYFPDFPNPEWAGKVTLTQLLSHTSGLAEYWTQENESAMLSFEHWHEYLPLIYNGGFRFEPGTEFYYSNSNFMLLGAIIEQASGQDYYQYIETHILKQSGMVSSGYFDHTNTQLPLALPYARQGGGGWINNRSKQFKRGVVLVTHESDIAAWARRKIVFRDGHILEDVLQQSHTGVNS